MTYWIDHFTGRTWQEFQEAGAKVCGFRERNWKIAKGIRPGDIFMCYLVGVKRWVGLLEVTGERYREETQIFSEETFPVRIPVRPLVILQPEFGVPMEELRGKVSFYTEDTPRGKWSWRVRSSPARFELADGEAIAEAIRDADHRRISRPVDAKLLNRSTNLYKLAKRSGEEATETIVSVPIDTHEDEGPPEAMPDGPTHTEIQYRLLDLGSKMGLNVWAPRSDHGREWNSRQINNIPRLLESLPTQFDEVTNRTIENIDVLWLNKNAIVAAFEVEHTTSIYSGLLRMSDLLTMQPNIDIKLYLAAPDERFAKFKREVPRPTFAYRNKPLHSVCGFLPYSRLCERLEEVKNVVSYLKPEFIDEIAEVFDPADEFDA